MAPTDPGKRQHCVLVTGYGASRSPVHPDILHLTLSAQPFGRIEVNPSWLAVSPLHDKIIQPSTSSSQRPISITTLGPINVSYTSVLSQIPPQHDESYDLFIHVGVAPVTRLYPSLRLETFARKTGYKATDVNGELAPVVRQNGAFVQRGFGSNYESFDDELYTDINVPDILGKLHHKGITDEMIRPSSDAGLYLCEFIFYCSLAESRRRAIVNSPPSRVLFIHVPQRDDPQSIQKATEIIEEVIRLICWES